MTHPDHYDFEKAYWADCCNTFDEEQKQFVYAKFMAIPQIHYSLDVGGKRILDIGGGPASLLLKTNLSKGKVVDPIEYPFWTRERYAVKGINVSVRRGEDFDPIDENAWDEVWIYNCLQHADDPGLIIENAKRYAKVLRIFEWVDIPPHPGHPHELTKASLDNWIKSEREGDTVILNESGCVGNAYFGAFNFS